MMTLIEEMIEALPLYAYPSKQLIQALSDMHLSRKTRLEISNIHYAGNDGGIMCAVEFPDDTVAVVSATNLVFTDRQPIYSKINEYTKNRIKALKSEHMASSLQQVGRNSSCPCGSGKKYKKCCGRD